MQESKLQGDGVKFLECDLDGVAFVPLLCCEDLLVGAPPVFSLLPKVACRSAVFLDLMSLLELLSLHFRYPSSDKNTLVKLVSSTKPSTPLSL